MAYIVQMSLSCSPATPAALAAFSKRWTPALQSSWSAISCAAASLPSLAPELNARIKSDCAQQIADDIAGQNAAAVQSVEAFNSTGWLPGSGGLHSGHASVCVHLLTGTGNTPWSFMADGTQIYVYVDAVFSENMS